MNDLLTKTLLETGNVKEAFVFNQKTGFCSAHVRKDFVLEAETSSEGKSFQSLFDKLNDFEKTFEDGFTFRDMNYECVRCDQVSIYGKCINSGGGCIITRTKHYWIACLYETGMHPSIAVEAIEELAAYLRSINK